MLIVRWSSHIEEDLKRNWSSWNFGACGFEGTREELQQAIDEVLEGKRQSLEISGFELNADMLRGQRVDDDFRELYPNYWVAVDKERGEGLSCWILESETIEDALKEIKERKLIPAWDGDKVDCRNAKIVYRIPDENGYEMCILQVD